MPLRLCAQGDVASASQRWLQRVPRQHPAWLLDHALQLQLQRVASLRRAHPRCDRECPARTCGDCCALASVHLDAMRSGRAGRAALCSRPGPASYLPQLAGGQSRARAKGAHRHIIKYEKIIRWQLFSRYLVEARTSDTHVRLPCSLAVGLKDRMGPVIVGIALVTLGLPALGPSAVSLGEFLRG